MSYVFIEENRPFLVHDHWLHYWNDGSKNWVTLREVSPMEEEFNSRRAIPEAHAAMYGFPFEKKKHDWEETIMNQRLRIEELEKQLRDAGDAMAVQDERIEELRAALEELVDFQNGPPLTKYEKDWSAAMRRALQLLGRPFDKPGVGN